MHSRCLVPGTAFYEWRGEKGKRRPVRFTMDGERLFAMAGLYSLWEHGGEPLATYTIITTEASDPVARYHGRMPIILAQEDDARWLSPETPPDDAHGLLAPYRAAELMVEEL